MRMRRRSNHSLGLKAQLAISILDTIIHLFPSCTLPILCIELMNANLRILPYFERNLFMHACPVRRTIDIFQALALCNFVVISTAPGPAIGVIGGDLHAMKSGYTPARARGGYGELPGVVLVASGGVGGARKGAEVEDAPKEGPAVGYVGDEDGGAGFTDVPKCPNGAERLREGVVFIEGGAEYLWRSVDGWKVECGVGGTYDEDSKAEETAQDCFPIFQLVWG
jgi:hypothetical protein